MCRDPPSTLNNLHKDSSRKSPKNAPRVSPNPRKDVARLSSEGPMVETNECPQDTPQDLAEATQELQVSRQFALTSQGLSKAIPKDFPSGFGQVPPPTKIVTFPEESPRDLSRTPKDFSNLPEDPPRHVPRSTKHFARPSQGFPEAITRDWTQDVAKIPEALRNQHFPQGSPGILPVSPTHFA